MLFILSMNTGAAFSQDQPNPKSGNTAPLILKKRVERALKLVTTGEAYVAIRDLDTGEYAYYQGDTPCQWASTVKIAVLYCLFDLAGQDKVSLLQRYTVKFEDMRLFSPCFEHFEPGINPAYIDLAYWMMAKSDNTASDVLINQLTFDRINNSLSERGLSTFRMEKTLQDILSCFVGLTPARMATLSLDEQRQALNNNVKKYRTYAQLETESGVLDYNRCTPKDMLKMVEIAVNPENYKNRELYVKSMGILLAGGQAFASGLPPKVRIYGKSGTLLSSLSGAALVITPDNRRYLVAIAINRANRPVSAMSPVLIEMLKIIIGVDEQGATSEN